MAITYRMVLRYQMPLAVHVPVFSSKGTFIAFSYGRYLLKGAQLEKKTFTTRIIIPADPLAKATLTFTSFDLELDYDFLQVYDGHNKTFPKLGGTNGFTGNTIPAPLTSTAADGALTITFTAESGVVAPGYEASISCVNNLNNSSFVAGIDFTYYPNPAKNSVTINSKNEISDIFVYNIAGQLLFSKKINSSLTNIDLSEFAVGTYFFKVKANNQEANFKILKL